MEEKTVAASTAVAGALEALAALPGVEHLAGGPDALARARRALDRLAESRVPDDERARSEAHRRGTLAAAAAFARAHWRRDDDNKFGETVHLLADAVEDALGATPRDPAPAAQANGTLPDDATPIADRLRARGCREVTTDDGRARWAGPTGYEVIGITRDGDTLVYTGTGRIAPALPDGWTGEPRYAPPPRDESLAGTIDRIVAATALARPTALGEVDGADFRHRVAEALRDFHSTHRGAGLGEVLRHLEDARTLAADQGTELRTAIASAIAALYARGANPERGLSSARARTLARAWMDGKASRAEVTAALAAIVLGREAELEPFDPHDPHTNENPR